MTKKKLRESKQCMIEFSNLKTELYDFQKRMIQDWLDAGGIDIIKLATGSGKYCGENKR